MMKLIFKALLAATLLPSLAFSQSSPGLYTGQVPSAAQWNSYFAKKQDALGYVPVNRSGDTMQGRLSFYPSSATDAGVNLNCGIAPTSPKDGDLWCTTVGVYARINGTTIGPFIDSTHLGAAVATSLSVPIISPPVDSTSAIVIQDAARANTIMTFDTTNRRVGINVAPGSHALNVAGTVNFSSSLDVVGALSFGPTSITGLTASGTASATDDYTFIYSNASGTVKKISPTNLFGAVGVASIAAQAGAFTCSNGIDCSSTDIKLTAARRTLPTTTVYTSGSGTFTKPANALWLEVHMVGGGGGGGNGTAGTAAGGGAGGGGGGAGGYCFYIVPSPSATYSYVVGTGGAAASVGGDSTFGSTTAYGGAAGANAAALGRAGNGGTGGITNSCTTGNIGGSGNAGVNGGTAQNVNVGGGGGTGGNSYFSAAGAGGVAAIGVAAGAGGGGGGGGGGDGAAGSGYSGGAGGAGKIIIVVHYGS